MDYREDRLSLAERELMLRLTDSAHMSLDVMAHHYISLGLSRDRVVRAIETAIENVEWELNNQPSNN